MRGLRALIVLTVVSLMTAGAAAAGMTGAAVKPRQGAERAWMDLDIGCWTARVTLQIGQTVWTFQADVEHSTPPFCDVTFTVCPWWGCGPLAEQVGLRNSSLGFEAEGVVVWGACRSMVCTQAEPEVCCHPKVTAESFAGKLGATRFAVASDPCDTPFFVCTKGI